MSSVPSAEELAAELRILAASLHEWDADDEARAAAMEHLREVGGLLTTGKRRLRWYEQPDTSRPPKVRSRDFSPFSGGLNAIAPPMMLEPGETDGGAPALIGRVRLDRLREGPPRTVHGGVMAGLFDEILGAGQRLTGRIGGVTGRLTVRYRKPTPLDQDLVFRSWVHDDRKRRLVMRADCRVGSTLTAEADAVFLRVNFAKMELAMRSTADQPSQAGAIDDPLKALLAANRRQPIDSNDGRPLIAFLCTGNAARSVMAAAMMRHVLGEDSPFLVSSGGTHVVPGQPMSVRTRRALERHDLTDPWHQSHQLDAADVERASVIVAMESMHSQWMQRTHPEGVSKTVSLPRLVRDLGERRPQWNEPVPDRVEFDARIESLRLGDAAIESWEEIIDPAGGEQADFDECADVINRLIRELHAVLL